MPPSMSVLLFAEWKKQEAEQGKLKRLLIEFGPPRRSHSTEEPFVRLTTDGIWMLNIDVDKRRFSDKQLAAVY